MSNSKKYFLILKCIKLKYFFFICLFIVFHSEKSFSFTNNSFYFHFTSQSLGRVKDDSLKKIINKEAHKASLFSTILPGLGQAYNKKYWKIPIIYAAIGGLGYFFISQNQDYQDYHNELLYRYSHNNTLTNSFKNLTTDQVNTEKILYKKHRDMLMIGIGIVYVLNIIDANVDAHLKKFDVTDNLSLSVKPKAFYCTNSPFGLAGGISIALNFR